MNTKITLEKRVLSVLLTFVMVFSMMPTSVFAENTGNAAYVTVGGVTAGFDTYELAVAYANEHEGSTLKLLTDVTAEQELEKFHIGSERQKYRLGMRRQIDIRRSGGRTDRLYTGQADRYRKRQYRTAFGFRRRADSEWRHDRGYRCRSLCRYGEYYRRRGGKTGNYFR